MLQISTHDSLFATAYMRGAQIFNYAGTGISGVNELIDKMRDHTAGFSGMVTLSIRNATRGWSQSKSIYLAAL